MSKLRNKDKQLPPIQYFSRTFFCSKCANMKRPFKDLKYLLFRATRQDYCVHTVPSLHRHPVGFTPHLVGLVNDKPNPDDEGNVGIYVYCCISGCGVTIRYNPATHRYDFWLTERREYWLPYEDVEVLLRDSEGFGFKI